MKSLFVIVNNYKGSKGIATFQWRQIFYTKEAAIQCGEYLGYPFSICEYKFEKEVYASPDKDEVLKEYLGEK